MVLLRSSKAKAKVALLLSFFAVSTAFSASITNRGHQRQSQIVSSSLRMTSEGSQTDTTITDKDKLNNNDDWFSQWAQENGLKINSKLSLRDPNTEADRGKGGVTATESIQALEVLARIPRNLVISAVDAPTRAMEAAATANNFTWAADLTAATLVALHPTEDELLLTENSVQAKQAWIKSAYWKAGGWATEGADLGPDDVNFGPKDVTGSLLATGSDNDHNIYAKFRMPCHPVILRASLGLGVLTGCTEEEARDVLTCRGKYYRSMRDALESLVLTPSEREKGSNREKRCWNVADTLSRVLSRATMLQLDKENKDDDDTTTANNHPIHAIVPLHDRLGHCGPSQGENTRLVAASSDEILIVATKDIAKNEEITRDYTKAPRLDQDESHGPLHLLTQFGLPPSVW